MLRSLFAPFLLCVAVALASRVSVGSVQSDEDARDYASSSFTALGFDRHPNNGVFVVSVMGNLYSVDPGRESTEALRTAEGWSCSPRFSLDGRKLAFINDAFSWNAGLWVSNADGSASRKISDRQFRDLIWLPDGKSLLALDEQGFVVELTLTDGATARFLHEEDRQVEALAYSYIKDELYFVDRTVDGRSAEIFVYDRSSKTVRQLSDFRLRSIRNLRLSPDETEILFQTTEVSSKDVTVSLYKVDLRTMSKVFVTHVEGTNIPVDAAYADDGYNAYILADGALSKINLNTANRETVSFSIRTETTGAQRVVRKNDVWKDEVVARHIRWIQTDPSEDYAYFTALGKLWKTELDSNRTSRLTSSAAREYAPSLSPDGKRLAYVSWSDADLGLLKVIDLKTGKTHRITEETGFYTNPVWSPDGRQLAYIAAVKGTERQYFRFTMARPHEAEIRLVDVSGRFDEVIARVDVLFPSIYRYFSPLVFGRAGSRIFYVRETPGRETHRRDLVSVDRFTSKQRVHLSFDNKIDHVLPSPDERKLAIVRRDGLSLISLKVPLSELENTTIESLGLWEERLSHTGAAYADWTTSNQIFWSFANRIYRSSIDQPEVEEVASPDIIYPRQAMGGTIAIVNARIVTMNDDEVIQHGTVVVENGSISAVGPSHDVAVPRDVFIIDATGKTIVPGLIDAHAHLHMWPFGGIEIFPEAKREYLASLAYGVTTVFDPSAPTIDVFTQADMIEAGIMLGPRVYSTGDIVEPSEAGRHFLPLESFGDALSVVRMLSDSGALAIKTYGHQSAKQRHWLVEAARTENIMILGHGGGSNAAELSMLFEGFRQLSMCLVAFRSTRT